MPNELSQFWVKGHGSNLTQTVQIRAHDGKSWGNWSDVTVKTSAPNNLPVVSIDDQYIEIGQTERDMYLKVSASDGDGDAITDYEIKDTTGINNFIMDNVPVDASSGYQFAAVKLNDLFLKADASASTQTLSIRAYDGKDWGGWKNFKLFSSLPNSLPTVSCTVPRLDMGVWVQYGTNGFSCSYSDGDGDTLSRYEVKAASAGHIFWLPSKRNFTAVGGQVVLPDELSQFWVKGHSSNLTQTVQIRAHDGKSWGNWAGFTVITSRIDLSHPLSQGIQKPYNSNLAETTRTSSEFQEFNSLGFWHGGSDTSSYTKINPLEVHNFHKAAGYGLTGQGLYAHVHDRGFKNNHSELSGKDIRAYGTLKQATGNNADDDHGLITMGVIGAIKNNKLVVGGAPKANFKVSDFGYSNWGDATRWAAAQNTVVQNNSWGFADEDYRSISNAQNFKNKWSVTAAALNDFQKTGVIVKAIPNDLKGNGSYTDGVDSLSAMPEFFPELKEAWINVANAHRIDFADGSSKYWRWSEQCAETAAYCLAGDASRIKGLNGRDDGTLHITQGTSFMAPQVSAAVMLLAEAFPSKSGKLDPEAPSISE